MKKAVAFSTIKLKDGKSIDISEATDRSMEETIELGSAEQVARLDTVSGFNIIKFDNIEEIVKA